MKEQQSGYQDEHLKAMKTLMRDEPSDKDVDNKVKENSSRRKKNKS